MKTLEEQLLDNGLNVTMEEIYRQRAEAAALIKVLREALAPLALLAEVFDDKTSLRPTTGEIMSWVDHRIGEDRVLTVEMLRNARTALKRAEARNG